MNDVIKLAEEKMFVLDKKDVLKVLEAYFVVKLQGCPSSSGTSAQAGCCSCTFNRMGLMNVQ